MEIKVGSNKKWYKSKTLWTNILILLGSFALETSGYIKSGGVLTIAALLNIGLRVLTKEGVKFSD